MYVPNDISGVDVESLPKWMQEPFAHLREKLVGDDESLALHAWIVFELSVADFSVSFRILMRVGV